MEKLLQAYIVSCIIDDFRNVSACRHHFQDRVLEAGDKRSMVKQLFGRRMGWICPSFRLQCHVLCLLYN